MTIFDVILRTLGDPREASWALLGPSGNPFGSQNAGVGDPVAGNIIFGTSECPEGPQGPYGPAQEGTILESFFGKNLALETGFHFSSDFLTNLQNTLSIFCAGDIEKQRFQSRGSSFFRICFSPSLCLSFTHAVSPRIPEKHDFGRFGGSKMDEN